MKVRTNEFIYYELIKTVFSTSTYLEKIHEREKKDLYISC